MRTTIELPDELYRALKARAGLSGTTFRALVQRLIEQGLHSSPGDGAAGKRREPPPVIVPARGVPLPIVTAPELARLEEEEDEAKYARPA